MIGKKASQKALEKIMNGEVKQKPRCIFFFRNVALWILGLASVFAGAIAVSLIIFTVVNSDMDLYREVYGFAMSRFTIALIVIWMIITSVLLILSDYSLRSTKCGYRYPLWFILSIDILISLIFGSIFYFFGVGNYMDDVLSSHVGYYHNVEKRNSQFFHKPEKGILMGVVTHKLPKYVEVLTVNGDVWAVHMENISSSQSEKIHEGSRVVFAGTTEEEKVFVACDMRVRKMHGIHQGMHEKHMKMIEEVRKKHQAAVIDRMHRIMIERACENGPNWKIAPQNH